MEYGLIGEKLGHSFSKDIHEMLADYKYELKEIPREDVDAFMKEKSFKGINVTIPYKETVIPYLDEVEDLAKEIGAVNCVVNRNGRLYGYNTDAFGMEALIAKMGVSLSNTKVLILGTGGTSKTAAAVAKKLGACKIIKVSRTESDETITYEQAVTEHADAEIIINTTPAGMYPKIDGQPIKLDSFKNLKGVVDAVYNPVRTNLVLEAQGKGVRAEGGLYMLVMQAVRACEIFTGKAIDKKDAGKVFDRINLKKENVVLIGMPGSGKSSVGKKLAKKLGVEFFDSDAEIVKREGREITEIFATDGEQYFRKVESEVIKDLSAESGKVIATGGGAILNPENVKNLKRNGKLIFLDRKLEDLIPTDDRPLGNSEEKIRNLYAVRYPIYKAAADEIVVVNAPVHRMADIVLRRL